MKKASRVVYELQSCPTVSTSPATVRFMYNYMMKDFTPANCKKAQDLQAVLRQGEWPGGCETLGMAANTHACSLEHL